MKREFDISYLDLIAGR